MSTKRVTFSPFSELAFIPKDQAESKWYCGQEMDHLRQELLQDAKRMSREMNSTSPGSIGPDQLYDCLGLEMFVTPGMARRVADEKQAHVRRVLHEQRLQAGQGILDVRKLARVAEKSQWTRVRAQKLALAYRRLE